MPIGLQISLLRDVSTHFISNIGVSGAAPRNPSKSDCWLAFGDYDYLSIRKLDKFSDINTKKTPFEDDQFGVFKLNLFPLTEEVSHPPDSERDQKAEGDRYVDKALEYFKASDSGLLAIVQANLSVRFFESTTSLENCEEGFRSVVKLVNSAFNVPTEHGQHYNNDNVIQLGHYWSLGGPDYVCILGASNVNHVETLIKTAQSLRSLKVDELCDIRERENAHLFGRFSLMLSQKWGFTPKQDDWIGSPKQLNATISILTPPGHEGDVASILSAPEKPLLLSGDGRLQTSFSSFLELAKFVNSTADGISKRDNKTSQQIDGTSTSIAIYQDAKNLETFDHEAVQLTHTLSNELNDIKADINEFAKNHLGKWHCEEIAKILDTIVHSFYRNERLGCIRDLLPFLRQLRKACKEHAWKKISSEEFGSEEISSSFDSLIDHAWRAVRNRIESRGDTLDPSFPNTVHTGANRLVNAYSVIAWLAWETLLGQHQSACNIDRFGACVCFGTSGRVECIELFTKLRRRVEEYSGDSLYQQRDSEWSANLLLLKISGQTLYKPEIAFLNCIHEVAERSGWSNFKSKHENESEVAFRTRFNEAVLKTVCERFINRMANANLGNQEIDLDEKAIQDYLTLSLQRLNHVGDDEFKPLENTCKDHAPLEYCGELITAFEMSIQDGENIKTWIKLPESCDYHRKSKLFEVADLFQSLFSIKNINSLKLQSRRFSSLTNEILADFATNLAVRQIAKKIPEENQSVEPNFVWLNDYIFSTILETTIDWIGRQNVALRLHLELVFARYAVQDRILNKNVETTTWRSSLINGASKRLGLARFGLSHEWVVNVFNESLSKVENQYWSMDLNDSTSIASLLSRGLDGDLDYLEVFSNWDDGPRKTLVESLFQLLCKASNHHDFCRQVSWNSNNDQLKKSLTKLDKARLDCCLTLWIKSQKIAGGCLG